MDFLNNSRTLEEQKRREKQKVENEKIGDAAKEQRPKPDLLNVDEMVTRFVWLSDGSQVADLHDPRFTMSYLDFSNHYAASTIFEKVNGRDVEVPVAKKWREHPDRMTVTSKTFAAGKGLVIDDPEGRRSINTWRGYLRDKDFEPKPNDGASLFFDHVQFLFGADSERFICWLAHIEQRPGELPHNGWLHVATNYGMGRNWIASVLTRLWAGYVASNVDLVGVLRTGFNGQLSRKVLAIVDELNEGGSGSSKWAHSEKLKSILNEERRTINPKYGRQSVEFNSCRWLVFSNHISAIPIEENDRRWNVSLTEEKPKSSDYYRKLYDLLDKPRFIQSVAYMLQKIDLTDFNPGEHAHDNAAKRRVREASLSEADEWAIKLREYWPSDLIDNEQLSYVLTGEYEPNSKRAMKHVIERAGFKTAPKHVRVGGKFRRYVVLRNFEEWLDPAKPPLAIGRELDRISNELSLLTDPMNHGLRVSHSECARQLLMMREAE